ncbi:hypothetical protein [Bacillus sp. FDAARGOS_235]|uniref:hypothetical protein n=1 Tax=Bacillus sp. FDAARGOS_235 TaxID=1839798 RepID=UPI00119F0423|nr:hypothetical protein [Bacillus sp. FDAARGOS_235]
MSVKIEVILKEIQCRRSTGDLYPESGFELEIRGGLGVSVGTTQYGPGNRESHTLFRKANNEGIEVTMATPITLNISKQLEVRPNEFVWVGGVLMEEDIWSEDDSLGDNRPNISFDVFNNMSGPFEKTITFLDTDQIIAVIYEFRRI